MTDFYFIVKCERWTYGFKSWSKNSKRSIERFLANGSQLLYNVKHWVFTIGVNHHLMRMKKLRVFPAHKLSIEKEKIYNIRILIEIP